MDFPETLFWSATYVALNCDNPESVYICKSGDVIELEKLTAEYRYLFLPDYAAELIRTLNRLDLVVNQSSFQEMTVEQVRYYLSLFSESVTGWLYSHNADRDFMNVELTCVLSDFTGEYFTGGPGRAFYEKLYGAAMNSDPKQLYLGTPI